jgi:hypothetical protein
LNTRRNQDHFKDLIINGVILKWILEKKVCENVEGIHQAQDRVYTRVAV